MVLFIWRESIVGEEFVFLLFYREFGVMCGVGGGEVGFLFVLRMLVLDYRGRVFFV